MIATIIVLWNVRPFPRPLVEAATSALVVGVAAGFKPATVKSMADLGWEVPER